MTDELRNKVNDWMAFLNTGDATLADGLYAEDSFVTIRLRRAADQS